MENVKQKDLLLAALEDSGLIEGIPLEKKLGPSVIKNNGLSNLPKTLKFSSSLSPRHILKINNISNISSPSNDGTEIIRQTSQIIDKGEILKMRNKLVAAHNLKRLENLSKLKILNPKISNDLSLYSLANNNPAVTLPHNLTIHNHYTMKEMLHGNYNLHAERLNLIDKEATEEEMAELEDQLRHIETYADYMPKKLRYGSKHPDPVVETNSLSSVEPPAIWYTPSLPETVIDLKALSALQLEAVIYACQQHENFLPDGTRSGFLIGDGPGVGKGRTIAAIIYENYILRRKRAIWFSVSNDLKYDAERDLRDIDAKIKLAPLNKFKYKKITAKSNGGFKKGIIFATYSSLIGERQNPQSNTTSKYNSSTTHSYKSYVTDGIFRSDYAQNIHTGTTLVESVPPTTNKTDKKHFSKYNTRIKQLLKWCGKDFDGVIVFDECHKAKNLVTTGSTKPTKTALAVLEIQKRLPKARIVYASATGATETKNMGYMVRLGLWGSGTPFQEFSDFIRAVERRGVGAMELVAMDMKLRGSYMARQLSFAGVSFIVREAKLDDNIIQIYNAAVSLWSKAHQKFQIALDMLETWGDSSMNYNSSNSRMNAFNSQRDNYYFTPNASSSSASATINARKKLIWAQFWAAHQRFFKYLCLATKVALCVELTKKALEDGKCVVIGLQSTGEARTLEAVEDTGYELMDFISTAKGIFQSLIEKHFPDSSTWFNMSDENQGLPKQKFTLSHQTVILNPDRPKLSKWTTARNSILNQATAQFTIAREEMIRRQRERSEHEAALKAKATEVLNFATSKQNMPPEYENTNKSNLQEVQDKIATSDTLTNSNIVKDIKSPSEEEDSLASEESEESDFDFTKGLDHDTTYNSEYSNEDLSGNDDLETNLTLDGGENFGNLIKKNNLSNKKKRKKNARNPFSNFMDNDDDGDDVDGVDINQDSDSGDAIDSPRSISSQKHINHHQSKKIRKISDSQNDDTESVLKITTESSSTTTIERSLQAIGENTEYNDQDNLLGSSLDKITLMKQELLGEIEELGERLPPNTLDQLIEELGGPDQVAEMTGRKGRVVAQPDGTVIYESRGEVDIPLEALNVIEKQRFMDGFKKIAIISEAASSGISLQSDRRVMNQLRRVHITLELPWSADKAIQQFGRTHRSNQVSAPEYIFLISELAGERRFASIVAKRLESLGALTHGDRRATESRDLSQFNFDNKYGRMALDNVMRGIINPRGAIVLPPASYKGRDFYNDIREGLVDVGFITKEVDGYALDKDYSNIVKFLNRILGLKVHLQNSLFQFFTDTLNAFILEAKRSGKWDLGILDFGNSGECVLPLRKQSFHFHTPRGVLSTQLWSFQIERGLPWEQAVKLYRDQQDLHDGFFISKLAKNGRVAPILALSVKTPRNKQNAQISTSTISSTNTSQELDGKVDDGKSQEDNLLFNVYRPNTGLQGKLEAGATLFKKYKKVPPQEVQKHWETVYDDSLTHCTHLLWKGNCRKKTSGHICEIGIRTRKYFVLAGSVLTVWNCLEELFNAGFQNPQSNNSSNPIAASKMQIIRVRMKDGQRIVGVWIKSNYVPSLVRILSRESNRADTEDFLQVII